LINIAIIGGGASGMMAATTLAEQSPHVKIILIEQNNILGQKVRMTGGGRCNVTTGRTDMNDILRRYPRGKIFLKHAMYSFPPWKVMEWFETHGVPLKVEEDLRVFPVSDKSDDIVGVFEKILEKPNVQILFGSSVEKVEKVDNRFVISLTNHQSVSADRLLIAVGGGGRGEGGGYALASSLGHTITPLAPSLNSFIVQEPWIKELAGVSFKRPHLKFVGTQNFASRFEFTGPFVFTHKGVTGPAVLALSSLAAYEKLTVENPARLLIDLFPELGETELFKQIQEGIAAHPKKTFENLLSKFVPKSVSTVVCQNLGIPAERIAVEVSKKDLNKSVSWIKGLPLTIIGRAAGEEFVTAGGVSLKEVDSKTMQSKICPGLFLAGEVLDVDAFTGGFNLQAAWATGRLAGQFLPID
jgi:predicted Rossmann fold flavoprotein